MFFVVVFCLLVGLVVVLAAELRHAAGLTQAAALNAADRLSSGTASQATLRRVRPYARKHGSPLLDPGIINEQTGTFRRSWTGDEPAEVDGDLTTSVYNTDPKAPFLEQPDGAPKSPMFARPVNERVLEQVAPVAEERVAEAVARALQS